MVTHRHSLRLGFPRCHPHLLSFLFIVYALPLILQEKFSLFVLCLYVNFYCIHLCILNSFLRSLLSAWYSSKSYRIVLNEINFCSLSSYLLRGEAENQTKKQQRNKELRKYQVVINIMMGIESSYVTVVEGYSSLEAIRDCPEEAMLTLSLNGNNSTAVSHRCWAEQERAASVSGAWCTFRFLMLEARCVLLRGPELLEGRTRQDLTLGANAQSYWASRRPKTSLQPSSVCVLLTLVLLRLSCVSLSTAAQDGCRSFHLLSGVGGGEGSGFGLSPWCFPLGPVFRMRLLFWFCLRACLPFKCAPSRVCPGDLWLALWSLGKSGIRELWSLCAGVLMCQWFKMTPLHVSQVV